MPKAKQYDEMTFWYLMLPQAHEDMFTVKDDDKESGVPEWCRNSKCSILAGPRIRYFADRNDMERAFFQLAAELRTDEFMCGTIKIKQGKKVSLKRMIKYEED